MKYVVRMKPRQAAGPSPTRFWSNEHKHWYNNGDAYVVRPTDNPEAVPLEYLDALEESDVDDISPEELAEQTGGNAMFKKRGRPPKKVE